MAVIYAKDLNGNLNLVNTIKLIKHGEGLNTNITEFNQMNDTVIDYLTAADAAYTTDDGGASIIYTENNTSGTIQPSFEDRPEGLVIDSEAGILYFQNENNGEGWQYNVGNSDFTIYNAIPNSVSQYLIKNSEGKLLKNGRIKPTGKVRMLHFEWDARNSRDLGGWDCDGGTVQYGKLFRGSVVNNDTYQPQNEIIAKRLGIRHQIDFRDDAEASYKTASNFGDNVWYRRITLNNYYKDIIDTAGADYPNTKKVFRAIFDAVLHNEPLYFNCSLGRDRTGTIAFMILALLGVARRDIEKEYELSSFSSLEEYKNQTLPALRTTLASPITYLANNFPGDTLRDNVVNWFAEAGFTNDEINAFRKAMIDGTPEDVTGEIINTYNITYNLTKCISDTSINTIQKGEELTIILTPYADYDITNLTVTMNGVDITNGVIAGDGNTISIINIDGDIYIEAIATKVATLYTNLIPSAKTTPYGEEIYNQVGYQNGLYLSGVENIAYSSKEGYVATGSIPVTITSTYLPTIYIKGIIIDPTTYTNTRFYFTTKDGRVLVINLFKDTSKYTLTKLADKYYKFEPVYNADGTRVLSTNTLANGNISFRLSGFGQGELLTVTIDEPIETATEEIHSITYNLTGVKSSNVSTKIINNSEYKSTLTFNSGYNKLDSISITMDGTDMTLDAYNYATNEITIDNVSGDLIITAVASYEAPYINQIPISQEESSTNIYNNGLGYKDNSRINSSGTVQDKDGLAVTGFIPCVSGNILYFKNLNLRINSSNTTEVRLAFYDSNKQIIVTSNGTTATPYWADLLDNEGTIVSDDQITSIKVPTYDTPVAFARFTFNRLYINGILTVNQEIIE